MIDGEKMTANKVLLVDPTCVSARGHQLAALKLVEHYLETLGSDVTSVAAGVLPEELAGSTVRLFGHNYPVRIPVATSAADDELEETEIRAEFANIDIAGERRAASDWLTLWEDHGEGVSRIVMPGADYYGAVGLLRVMQSLPSSERPSVRLRLLGVMENAAHGVPDPLGNLVGLVRDSLKAGVDVELAAETPAYCTYLTQLVGRPVTLVPYPPVGVETTISRSHDLVVSSLGTGRADKGIFKLEQIARNVRRLYPGADVKFIVQLPPFPDVVGRQNTFSHLYSLPNVEIAEPDLTPSEMESLWAQTDVAILPYAAGTYRLRGSAILMEALNRKRLVLTHSEVAFASQVEYYQCGSVCEDESEYPHAIGRLVDLGEEGRLLMAEAAQARFIETSNSAWNGWLA